MSVPAETRPAAPRPSERAPLHWMAFAAFAVGTESFMIAAILPDIAADLSVDLQTAGQLVAVFALTYAVSSPVLTVLTGSLDRRRLLILSMAVFAAGNLVAGLAASFAALLAARVLLACAAGLYVPNANALAGALVPPERRGRAIATITGGISLAVALGVPLGAVTGAQLGWRMTFIGVAALAFVALLGLVFGLPKGLGRQIAVAGLSDRLAVLRNPTIVLTLLVTTLWAIGGFTVYTYIAIYLQAVTGLDGEQAGGVLFLWGAAAFLGILIGGRANDRFGGRRVVAAALPVSAISLFGLSAIAYSMAPAAALLPALVAMVAWSASAWAFFPAQSARLIGIAGVSAASVVLSLNASFQYLGFSLGATLGAVVLSHGGTADLGWVGGLCMLASLLLNASLRPARDAGAVSAVANPSLP